MATIELKDDWTNVRVRKSLVEEMNEFIKKNPGLKFDNPSQLVSLAIKQLFEKGVKS